MNIIDVMSFSDSKMRSSVDIQMPNRTYRSTELGKINGHSNSVPSIHGNQLDYKARNTHRDIRFNSGVQYGVGYRSPCVSLQQYHGATSPAVQGRSVREFEEHTAALRKENFNLKLRLYFIEENIPALKSNGADGCDTAMRELIEHKVEIEMLRRELEEKKAVLKDALQAIEDLEKLQKETEMNYEAKMDDLKHKIQFLEVDRTADKSENNDFMNNILGRSDIVTEHVNNLQRIRELEAIVKTSEDTISELENKVTFLDGILAKRDQNLKEFEDKIKSLEYKNAELQEEIQEKNRDIASSEDNGTTSEYTTNHYLEKCLREARNQQESIDNLQTNLSLRVQNSERLLERFREFEKCIDKMREERRIDKKKNHFLWMVIKKLRNQLKDRSEIAAKLASSEKVKRSVTVETFKRFTSTATKKSNIIKQSDYKGTVDESNMNANESDISLSDIEEEDLLNDAESDSIDFDEIFADTFSIFKQTSRLNSTSAFNKSSNYTWVGCTHEQQDRSKLLIILCKKESSFKGEKFPADIHSKTGYESYCFRILRYTLKCLCYPIGLQNFYLRIGQPGAETGVEKIFKRMHKKSTTIVHSIKDKN